MCPTITPNIPGNQAVEHARSHTMELKRSEVSNVLYIECLILIYLTSPALNKTRRTPLDPKVVT